MKKFVVTWRPLLYYPETHESVQGDTRNTYFYSDCADPRDAEDDVYEQFVNEIAKRYDEDGDEAEVLCMRECKED